MTRVAAFDCGTNSLRLLIADIEGDVITDVVREMRVVRLGQGVDATGAFAAESLERTFAACEEYNALCEQHKVTYRRFVATSAARDVSNREEFIAGVTQRVGVTPEIISGDEEAELSFIGAVTGIAGATDPEAPAPTPPHLVMDLGGGSTELVLGDTQVDQGYSMDIGCVRMTERHLRSDPPTSDEISAAIADIDAAYDLASTRVNVGAARSLIGVAGTITTVAAQVLGLRTYDSQAIHGTHLPLTQLATACVALTSMTRAQRAELGFMHPGRVDVIGAGALVFARLVERISSDVSADGGTLSVFVSETDILDGIALSIAE